MIQVEMKSLSPDHGCSAILSKESVRQLVSTGESRMFLRRKGSGSKLCFGEVNLPSVNKRMGKKGPEGHSQEFPAYGGSEVVRP